MGKRKQNCSDCRFFQKGIVIAENYTTTKGKFVFLSILKISDDHERACYFSSDTKNDIIYPKVKTKACRFFIAEEKTTNKNNPKEAGETGISGENKTECSRMDQ